MAPAGRPARSQWPCGWPGPTRWGPGGSRLEFGSPGPWAGKVLIASGARRYLWQARRTAAECCPVPRARTRGRAGLGSHASHTGFCSLRLSRSMKSPTVLRALTTQKQNSTPQGRGLRAPPRSSLQPPPPTKRHLCPGTMRAARAPRPPMLTAGPSGKPGSRARPPPRWAGPVGGSSWTPGPPSPAGAFSEGSSTRTSPPWGASQLRTLRRHGRPRLAPRASPTGRWCVREGLLEWPCGGFSRGAGVRPPPRTISGWGRWFRRFQEHGGLFLVECAARQSCCLSGAEREMGGSTNPCRSVLSLSADSRGLSVLPLAQRARSGAEGASDEDWAAGQLWR